MRRLTRQNCKEHQVGELQYQRKNLLMSDHRIVLYQETQYHNFV